MQTKVLQLPTGKNLKINEKFKNLLRKLTERERKELQLSIKRDGVIDPIRYRKAGDGSLEIIDGHNRYEIATELGLPFEMREVKFTCPLDEAVMYWMYQHQSARRGGEYADVEMTRLMVIIKKWMGENGSMASAIRQVAADTGKSPEAIKKANQRADKAKTPRPSKTLTERLKTSLQGTPDANEIRELITYLQTLLEQIEKPGDQTGLRW